MEARSESEAKDTRVLLTPRRQALAEKLLPAEEAMRAAQAQLRDGVRRQSLSHGGDVEDGGECGRAEQTAYGLGAHRGVRSEDDYCEIVVLDKNANRLLKDNWRLVPAWIKESLTGPTGKLWQPRG